MPVELLIDGYNLLHNAGLGHGKLRAGEFERARDRLLRRLSSHLSEAERAQTTIIFDAQYAEHADRRPLNLYGMTVIFSPRGRQADDLIEILLAAHRTPRQVLVISSDCRLQRAARHAHAEFMSSDSFLVELDERKSNLGDHPACHFPAQTVSARKAALPEVIADADTDRWLQEFGEIDVQAITRDVIGESSPGEQSSSNRKNLEKKRDMPSEFLPARGELEATANPDPSSATDAAAVRGEAVNEPDVENSQQENSTLPSEDLRFWEQRVQEMLHEETFDPGQRRRK